MAETPPPTPPPPPGKPKQTRGPINQAWLDEIALADELRGLAAKTVRAPLFTDEGVTAEVLTGLKLLLKDARKLVTTATGSTANKSGVTQTEDGKKQALLTALTAIQKRAKDKYPKSGDPGRARYFINQPIGNNRAKLDSAAEAILENAPADALPGLKAAETTALSDALANFRGVQEDQREEQGTATTARNQLKTKVADIAEVRRKIQRAADRLWPADNPENAGLRGEFQIPPDKALA